MAIETEADRAMMLAAADWGVVANYTPLGGSPQQITGIFDAPHEGVSLGAGGVVSSSTGPQFLVTTASLVEGGRQFDLLTIPWPGGTAYRVIDPQPDGTGMTTLILEKA